MHLTKCGTETTKFINNFGYNFQYNSEAENYDEFRRTFFEKYDDLIQEKIKEEIIEVDNYIIVNVSNYLAR